MTVFASSTFVLQKYFSSFTVGKRIIYTEDSSLLIYTLINFKNEQNTSPKTGLEKLNLQSIKLELVKLVCREETKAT